MQREVMRYGKGTELTVTRPWGLFLAGAARCPDGKVRRLKRIAGVADTLFTIPAAVEYKRKTVSGYVTLREDDEGERVVEFVPYVNRKNGHLFEV